MTWGGRRPNAGARPKDPERRKAADAARAAARAVLTDQRAAAKAAADAAPPVERKEQRRINFQAIQEIIQASNERAKNRERTREWCPFVIRSELMGPRPPKNFDMAFDQSLQNTTDFAINAWMTGGLISNIESEGLLWLGYPLLSELAQKPEYRVMSETIATEMTRKWIRFKGTSTSTADGEEDDDKPPGSNPPSEIIQSLAKKPGEEDPAEPEPQKHGEMDRPPDPDDRQELEGRDASPGLEARSNEEMAKRNAGEMDDDAESRTSEIAETAEEDNEESQFEPTRPRPKGKGDGDKSQKIKELTDFLEDLKIRDRFAMIALHDGLFGRAHLFLDVGADLDEMRGEIATPIGNGRDEITKGKLRKGCLRALRVIEPVWTYPTTYNAQNPLRHDWYNPQIWYVMGKEIHCSRLLTFISRPVPDLLKPAYSFGGLALSQLAKPYIDIWLQTRSSVGDLIHSFSVMVLMTDIGSILQPGSGAQLAARVAMFNALRDNQGTFAINKETEDFKNVSASLAGLHELQAQSQEHMASVARIPLVKFTGIQPSGLNASSEGEIRVWYDTISAMQNAFFRPALNTVIDIAQVSLWGEVDPDITWDFVPLWSMTEKEEAEVRKIESETGQILVDTGIISQEEERTRIAADPDSPYPGLDPEDVPELIEEEAMGLQIPHGHPGEQQAEAALGQTGEQAEGREPAPPGSQRVIPFAGRRRQVQGGDQAVDEFQESDHPRDQDGKWTSGGGGGAGGEPEPSSRQPSSFKTKKDHAEHLLKRGVTTKEMLSALGWPSISMPAMAKSLNMRLEKVKEGKVTKYIGHSLGPREQPEKTHSLLPFLAKRGGLRSDAGNIADVRAAIGAGNKFLPGFGQLIRTPKQLSTAAQKGGQYAPMDLDTAREAAAEAGYISESTTLPEFIEMMDRELRGQRVYPEGYLPEGRSSDPDELEHQQNGFMAELHNSVGELSDTERTRAVELWTHEGLNDPIDVLERIAFETDDREVSTGAEPRSQPIPGWDDDGSAVPF